jgi:hypothetical protein
MEMTFHWEPGSLVTKIPSAGSSGSGVNDVAAVVEVIFVLCWQEFRHVTAKSNVNNAVNKKIARFISCSLYHLE